MGNDEKSELLADLRAWLEWQQSCGADLWMVEDWDAWTRPMSAPPPSAAAARPPRREAPVPLRQEKRPPPKTRRQERPQVKRPPEALGGGWKRIMSQAPESFSADSVPKGRDGIERIKEFYSQNCVTKACRLGIGRAHADVVLVEGSVGGLKPAGFSMLSKMREHVLGLPRENLYWLPAPMEDGCGRCMEVFSAQLRALSPKALLLMGDGPVHALDFQQTLHRPELGKELVVKGPDGDIPAVWTHHPNHLLENPHDKLAAMRHLEGLRDILVRLGIRS
jgi:hypothetical protein